MNGLLGWKMKFSIKDFFGKCDQIRVSYGFDPIYWRNPLWITPFFVQYEILLFYKELFWNNYLLIIVIRCIYTW